MAKLIRYEKEVSLEEYVIAEVCANYGTQTRVTVPVLKHILDVYEITYIFITIIFRTRINYDCVILFVTTNKTK